MLSLAKLILGFFDKFTQDKVFKFIKTIINNKINTLLDVGSHKGEYIININKSFLINKIFGFEPSPRSYEILLRNTKKMDNTEVFNSAVGKEDGVSILNQNIESSSSSINSLNERSKYFKR
jgi:FkbM family methyltransferase